MLDRFLSSPQKVALAVFLAALAFYAAAGWDIGPDALDSDTLSLVLQWKLIRDGTVLDDWILSTPKFLPVVVDGSLYELGSDTAVYVRSLVTSALLVALATLFAHLTVGWQAGLVTAGLLLFSRTLFGSAYSGNSTTLYATFLLGAVICFLKWPARRAAMAGLVLLFGASLTRIEGLSYLGLAGLAMVVASWRRDRSFSLSAAGITAALIMTVFAADFWVPSTLSGRLRSGRSVTLEINQRAKRIADIRESDEMYAQAVERIQQGYLKTAVYHLGRVLRPIFILLPLGLAGVLLVRRRTPLAACLLVFLAIPPLIYCGVLHFLGVALFERFFLPTALAIVIAASFALHEAFERLGSLPSKVLSRAGVAVMLLLTAGLLAIGARDIYYQRNGYLVWRAENLQSYKAGLAQLKDVDLTDKHLFVYGWHHAYTNLVLKTQTPHVEHSGDALLIDEPGDELSGFDYLLYGKGDGDVDRLFEDVVCSGDHCTLETPSARFETFWISPNGEFQFFKKTS